MDHHIFREYDLRGVADVSLTSRFAFALGQAFADLTSAQLGRPAKGLRVVLGRDARLSGPRLMSCFEAGLHQRGVLTLSLGLAPTPLIYFALHHLHDEPERRCDAGVAITGSHNPPEWNGFKLCVGREAIYGEALQRLRALTERALEVLPLELSDEQLTPRPPMRLELDLTERYAATLSQRLTFGERRLKVVVDGGNGALGPLASALYERLPIDVVPLYLEPDGRFPHHHPDPTVEANLSDLKRAISTHHADLGVAFDGDGDRVGVMDETGHVLWGDQLMIFFARDVLSRHPGAPIIGEVKCSQALYDEIERAGGQPVMWRVGHSLIKAQMKALNAPLAGEMSGHIFFADRFEGYDDAAYVGARLLELLSKSDEPLSAWREALPQSFTTPEIRVDCPDHAKADVIARAVAFFEQRYEVGSVDGVRVLFEEGWGLLRASNTQPVLVMRVEASSQQALDDQLNVLQHWLRAHAPEVSL